MDHVDRHLLRLKIEVLEITIIPLRDLVLNH